MREFIFRFRLRQQALAERLGEKEGGTGVDGNVFVKAVRLHVEDIAPFFDGNPGIVQQAIEAAPSILRGVEHLFVQRQVGNIRRETDDFCAFSNALLPGGFQLFNAFSIRAIVN